MSGHTDPPPAPARISIDVAQRTPEYVEGFLAERDGLGASANPYHTRSHAWAAGWLAARENPYSPELPT